MSLAFRTLNSELIFKSYNTEGQLIKVSVWIFPTDMKKVVFLILSGSLGFLGGSDGKELACKVGDVDMILGWEGPLEEGMALVFFLGEFPGQRSLVGYNPWSCKELDTIEWCSHSASLDPLSVFGILVNWNFSENFKRLLTSKKWYSKFMMIISDF